VRQRKRIVGGTIELQDFMRLSGKGPDDTDAAEIFLHDARQHREPFL